MPSVLESSAGNASSLHAPRQRTWQGATYCRKIQGGVKIRPIETSDLPALRPIVSLFDPGEGFGEQWLGGWPREGDRGVVAVDDTAGVIGASWYRRPEERPTSIPQVLMAVMGEYRGRGIGRRLLAANVEQAREAGLMALHVVVRPDNHASLHLLAEYDARLTLDKSPRSLEYVIVLDKRLQVPPVK